MALLSCLELSTNNKLNANDFSDDFENEDELLIPNSKNADINSIPHGIDINKTQIKFAHGTTTLAFRFNNGAVVAVDSRATSGEYIASTTVNKVLPINKYLLGTMAGGAADCQYWDRVLAKHCRMYELRNKERMSVAAASKLLSNMLYSYKGSGLSLGVFIVGCDKRGPAVYYLDDDGTRLHGNVFSCGSGSPYAVGLLDTFWKWEMKDEEAFELARRAIAVAGHRDAASGGICSVYHMQLGNAGWRLVSQHDISELYYKYAEEKSKENATS